jgi:hypothetical protein
VKTKVFRRKALCVVSYVAGREDEAGARREHITAVVEAASREIYQANWRPPRLRCLSWVKVTREAMHSVPMVSQLETRVTIK